MNPPPTLDTIPFELITAVGNVTSKDDLRSLHSTCKRVNAAIYKNLGRAFFEHRRYVVSVDSLRGLVDITADVTWGPFVRSVSLDVNRFPDAADDILDSIQQSAITVLEVGKRPDPGKVMDERVSLCRSMGEQKELERGSNSLAYVPLEQAFTNLAKHGISIELGTWDDNSRLCPPCWIGNAFYSIASRDIDERSVKEWRLSQRPLASVALLLRAAQDSGIKFQALKVTHNNYRLKRSLMYYEPKSWRAALLQLDRTVLVSTRVYGDDTGNIASNAGILSETHHLQSLHVELDKITVMTRSPYRSLSAQLL